MLGQTEERRAKDDAVELEVWVAEQESVGNKTAHGVTPEETRQILIELLE